MPGLLLRVYVWELNMPLEVLAAPSPFAFSLLVHMYECQDPIYICAQSKGYALTHEAITIYHALHGSHAFSDSYSSCQDLFSNRRCSRHHLTESWMPHSEMQRLKEVVLTVRHAPISRWLNLNRFAFVAFHFLLFVFVCLTDGSPGRCDPHSTNSICWPTKSQKAPIV